MEAANVVANSDNIMECDQTDASAVDGHGKRKHKPKGVGVISAEEDADEYKMDHPYRGKAIIFNHKEFNSQLLETRWGTDIDKKRLTVCLENLNFEVKVYNDLIRKDVLQILEDLQYEDYSARDCLLVIVLSHGNHDKIYAKDKSYRPEELWNNFTADSCPSLAGKPKLFFIQACRGNTKDCGTELQKGMMQIDSCKINPGTFSYIVPNWTDFLIAFSTPPGYVSWRSEDKGSWFIDSLVTVLEEKSGKLDLQSMMTLVTRKVALSYISTHADPKLDQMKQVPMTSSTLTRLLYFTSSGNN